MFMKTSIGQGATEYLVLLAVVLIVALVSVALLGFFPGMASDAQLTQSQMYWQSASPVAIVESMARTASWDGITYPYIRVKNRGAYPIRITALIGGDGLPARQFAGTNCGASYPPAQNMSDFFYLGPGEEKYIGPSGNFYGLTCDWEMVSVTGASGTVYAGGASSVCQNTVSTPGMLGYKTFGFEYIEYVDNQQITKRQIGKEFIVKCRERY